jgi:catechol 2,3-dioxygenase-like lactoylglutathione lyase family enzyme
MDVPSIKRTTVVVQDIDRARAFYRDVLGMKVWFDREYVMSGEGMPGSKRGDRTHLVIMEAQDARIGKIGLLEFKEPRRPDPTPRDAIGPGSVIFVGDVTDVDALNDRLVAAGARITAPPHLFEVAGADGETLRLRRVCFFDPDGHFFEMNQPA